MKLMRSHCRRALVALAPATIAALLLSGCAGSSSSPGVAHLSSSTSASSGATGGGGSPSSESSAGAQQKMVAYSQCMRTHGVPEFPEPNEGKLTLHSQKGNGRATGVDPSSAKFQSAQKACKKLAPNGGKPPSPEQQAKFKEQALKFSKCMRSHGVPSFPDPEIHFDGGGGVGIRIGGKKGAPGAIDPSSPGFKAAQKTCQSIMGGPKGPPGEGQALRAGP